VLITAAGGMYLIDGATGTLRVRARSPTSGWRHGHRDAGAGARGPRDGKQRRSRIRRRASSSEVGATTVTSEELLAIV
jgi:hypothetical protein